MESLGLNALADSMKQFCFLVSSERSGSNLVTSLMNSHPSVSGPSPTHLFRLFATNRGNYGDLSRDENWRTLIDDLVENFDAKLGSWVTRLSGDELARRVDSRTVTALLRAMYEEEAESDGAEWVFVKENYTYSFAPFLLENFPECRFVVQVRDPRDVASSRISTKSAPGGVEEAISIWLRDQTAARDLLHQLRGTGRVALVRYEDLIGDTESALRELTGLMGLDFDEEMLLFHRHPRTKENSQRIDAWSNLRRPVMMDNAGKYKRVLSEHDLRFVELACYDLMTTFGYECDLVKERAEPSEVQARLAELRPRLTFGRYEAPSEDEDEIRERRLRAIDRVLSRRLS
ncbi:MAG: sulfotransferase [bacterium]|nr:sulfotransferase [bacterium]